MKIPSQKYEGEITRIISASRRTDLPGYHPDVCVARLRRLRKPVHSVFFWTRYPAAFTKPGAALGEMVRYAVENPFVHLTVTGLGGTPLEPHVPSTSTLIKELDGLISVFKGEPSRILWRFDPLIKEMMSVSSFASLGSQMSSRGIRTCIISFPAHLSLKGSLDDQYQRFAIKRWTRQEKRDFSLRLAESASRLGIDIRACNQPKVCEDTDGVIQPAACISAELAQRHHPQKLPLQLPKDPSQRRHCNCVVSDDIGHYADLCQSGCAYCYSSAGGPR